MSKLTFTDYILNCNEYIEIRKELDSIIKSMHDENQFFIGTEAQKKQYEEITKKFNDIVISKLENYTKKYCN